MKRFFISAVVVAVISLVAAACGAAKSSSSASATGTKGGRTIVMARQIPGAGTVLVDASGQPLYAADQEASGMVHCNGTCTSFWKPLTISGGSPTASVNGKLGVVTRPDGSRQVTFNGKLLYTFTLNQPGKVTGDGFMDAFSGQHFTWHVIRVSGASAASGGSQAGGGGSGGTQGSSGSGTSGIPRY
jgi:predicted lipoprotein with Yx(FWY)xxD motif